MKITALVENYSKTKLTARHGLSLYIETSNHKILFDLGPDKTIFKNAKQLNIDLSLVDIVIISHGHIDHGGALKEFLKINSTAKIYLQRNAFEKHFSKFFFLKVNIGLNERLKTNSQIVLLDGDYIIDNELSLFTIFDLSKSYICKNNILFENGQLDTFSHEQNLLIKGSQNILIMGCGHAGVISILNKVANEKITYCIGGYHLTNPLSKKTVSPEVLQQIIKGLKKYPMINFYTCHCTGRKVYHTLKKELCNMNYLSCGEVIKIND